MNTFKMCSTFCTRYIHLKSHPRHQHKHWQSFHVQGFDSFSCSPIVATKGHSSSGNQTKPKYCSIISSTAIYMLYMYIVRTRYAAVQNKQ